MNATLTLLLSRVGAGALAPAHRADLERSGITEATRQAHYIRSVPQSMRRALLGFDLPGIESALLFPHRAPTRGFMDCVRMKIFPTLLDRTGHKIKYLGPKQASPRLYFHVPSLPRVLSREGPLWLVEGYKQTLAIGQLGAARRRLRRHRGLARGAAAGRCCPTSTRFPCTGAWWS